MKAWKAEAEDMGRLEQCTPIHAASTAKVLGTWPEPARHPSRKAKEKDRRKEKEKVTVKAKDLA